MKLRAMPMAAFALSVAAGGCSSFTTPRPATRLGIAAMPLARLLPGRCELELDSPGLTGTFDVVVAVTGDSFRVQLFPDVGGKVLDVQVDQHTVTADLPGHHYEVAAPLDAAPPHLALAFALLFGELLAPLRGDRVLGERVAGDDRSEVQLRPSLGAGQVRARLGPDLRVEHYWLQLGRIEFELAADGAFGGRGFRGRLLPIGG